MVFDGSQTGNPNRLKGYVDGVEQSLSFNANPVPSTTPTNSAYLYIGYDNLHNISANGKIDDVRIYNRPLSAQEVKDLYDGVNCP